MPMKTARWLGSEGGLLVVLTLMNVLNFVDRQLLASFANFIVPDLNLTNTQFGLLTGLVFLFFYAVAGAFMGALADIVHRPRFIAAAMSVWSALTAMSGMAVNFLSLAVPRIFIGVGEAALTPTAMSLLADRIPAERRGFAAGFYYMGVPLGVGASLVIAGVAGPTLGWRNCFLVLGAVGVAFSLLVLWLPEPRSGRQIAVHRAAPFRTLLRTAGAALMAHPALPLTIAGGVCVHFLLGAATFEQLWLVRERGFEAGQVALASGLIACVAGVGGNLFGGLASDRWVAKTGQSRPMFMVWLLMVMLPVDVVYRLIDPGHPLFWACMAGLYFQVGAFYGPTFAAVQNLCPPQVRSTVVGIYIMSLNIVGLGIGVTLSGVLVDVLHARQVAQPYTWTLVVFTVLSGLAIPCYYAAARARGSVPTSAVADGVGEARANPQIPG
jgi:MFS family permease